MKRGVLAGLVPIVSSVPKAVRAPSLGLLATALGLLVPHAAHAQGAPAPAVPPPAATTPAPPAAAQPPAPPAPAPPAPFVVPPLGQPVAAQPAQPFSPPPAVAPGAPPPGYPYPYYPQRVYAPTQPLEMEVDDDGQPAPAGYVRQKRPRRGAVLAGMGVLAPFYAFSVTAAIASENKADRWLIVPVLGPAIDMIARPRCKSSEPYACSDNDGLQSVFIFDFLAQAAGATLMAIGYLAPRELFVRADAAPASGRGSLPIVLVPGPVGKGHGLSAVGLF